MEKKKRRTTTAQKIKQNQENFGALSKARSQAVRQALEIEMAKRKYQYADVLAVQDRLARYYDEQTKAGKPLTVAGFILASQLPQSTFYEWQAGDYDSITAIYREANNIPPDAVEHITEDGEIIPLVSCSEVIEKCYLLLQQQREQACSSLKGNPAGNIFLLKAQHGFKEDNSPQTVNQTLVIADAQRAKECLDMLK